MRLKNIEKEVDQLETEIQSRALKLLCFQQPVARDLRDISTALNLITDMERIADQTVDIAEILLLYSDEKLKNSPKHIIQMVENCIVMVTKSIDSFVKKDIETANNVIESDDEVDSLFSYTRDDLINAISQNSFDKDRAIEAIDFIMIAKYLERIADHAVNIAEWVIFNVTGEHKDNKIL